VYCSGPEVTYIPAPRLAALLPSATALNADNQQVVRMFSCEILSEKRFVRRLYQDQMEVMVFGDAAEFKAIQVPIVRAVSFAQLA
jgi:hypothetical protein